MTKIHRGRNIEDDKILNVLNIPLSEALKKIPKERKKEVVNYIILKLTEIRNILDYEKTGI